MARGPALWRAVRCGAFGWLVVSSLLAGSGGAQASAPWPHEVQAVYKVRFNGLEVGTFEFNATVSAQTYTLTVNAHLSILLGALNWTGETRAAGTLSANAPKPAGYAFDFSGIGKSGSVRMNFVGDRVSDVSLAPQPPAEPGIVQVRNEHLKGVLDPLTAVMALSRSTAANPCGRKLAVFDGRHRFDLLLSFNREERVVEARPSGQPVTAYVCRVHYVPVAGHKMNEETRHMAASLGIELTMRPVPSVGLFVPYQITIPTIAGSATLTAHTVQITSDVRAPIALVY